MSREKIKVLEMVAEGKISPEEGVRLIEALGEADRAGRTGGSRGFPLDMSELRMPRIDLGHLGQVYVELKKSVTEGARRAQNQFRRSRAGKFFEFKDYPLEVERPSDVDRCKLRLDIRAGKLKLKGQELEGRLLMGKVKRAPEAPTVITEVHDGETDITLRHSLGRCLLRTSTEFPYRIHLDNSAADSRLQLENVAVPELDIENNAGSVAAALGELVDKVTISVSNNAGNVRLKVPGTHALKITPSGTLSTDNLDKHGLEVVDGVAVSQDWDSNPKGITIALSQNVANFKLDWKRRDGVRMTDLDQQEDLDELENEDL
jgi:hypothetical protein